MGVVYQAEDSELGRFVAMGRPAFYQVEPALLEYEIESNGVALFERKTGRLSRLRRPCVR
jgi:hypothetical protein